jgi:glutathione S-transferase
MHSSFGAIRNACPMNLRRPVKLPRGGLTAAIQKDVTRIESLWAQCRKTHGKGGPFLFGKFSAADAMFAPVVARFETFTIPVKPETRHYMDAIIKTAAFQNWKTAALKEPWIVPEDEVD